MLLIILLAISILSQFFAAIVAVRLTSTTKFNAAWILITIALVLTCLLMIGQFLNVLDRYTDAPISIDFNENVSIWLSVAISLCFAVGVFLIKKVLEYISLEEEHRRRMEEQILNAIIHAEETQRQLFAKELHDDLGPLLSTAKLSISALAARSNNELDKEIITNTDQAITLSIKSIKDISNNLSPHILNNFGLGRALSNFINRVRPVAQTKIIFHTNLKEQRFSPDSEIAAYRVVCELINNSIKHAGSKNLIISIQYDLTNIEIMVKDDGRGFDTRKKAEGMGLSNIASRIGSIKGTINISSGDKIGTEVRIKIPMAPITVK